MIRIRKKSRIVRSVVSLTPSKSIINRALIIRALSEIKFDIINKSLADDCIILEKILNSNDEFIDVKDSGTAFRFLTAYLSIKPGRFILSGSERMKKRPIGKLVNALNSVGAGIQFMEKSNYPPLEISGRDLNGGKIQIDASESSQYVSALLLIAPKLSNGLTIELLGKDNSKPYIEMTISLMRYFGIEILSEKNKIIIHRQEYRPVDLVVENDWSSASFWYLIAALSDESEIILKNLNRNSIQGDSVVDTIMKNFGVESEISGNNLVLKRNKNLKLPEYFNYDFSNCPDLVIPIAVLCAALKIPAEFTGTGNLRIKESDRLLALQMELSKIGANVEIKNDAITINPVSVKIANLIFHSHNDHRMVMSLAPLALLFDEIEIDDHLIVNKSYPEFWEDLKAAGFEN